MCKYSTFKYKRFIAHLLGCLLALSSGLAVANEAAPNLGEPNMVTGQAPDSGQAPAQEPTSDDQQTSPASKAAFNKLLHQYFPLTPKQISKFKEAAADQQKASSQPAVNGTSEGTSSTVVVQLKPGSIQPIVRGGAGKITSLVFTDASGNAWPIVSYSIGNADAFSVKWNKSSSVLLLQGQKLYATTNIAVMLKGLNIPVMVTLILGQKQWDYLDYIRVNADSATKAGASNEEEMMSSSVSTTSPIMVNLLDGQPPGDAQPLIVQGGQAQVWSLPNGDYVMLTNGVLLSPRWTRRLDGTGHHEHAYEFPAAPLVMVSINGQVQQISINGAAGTSI